MLAEATRRAAFSLSLQRGEISPDRDPCFEPMNQEDAPRVSPSSPQRGEGLGMRGGSTSDREQVQGEGFG